MNNLFISRWIRLFVHNGGSLVWGVLGYRIKIVRTQSPIPELILSSIFIEPWFGLFIPHSLNVPLPLTVKNSKVLSLTQIPLPGHSSSDDRDTISTRQSLFIYRTCSSVLITHPGRGPEVFTKYERRYNTTNKINDKKRLTQSFYTEIIVSC